MDSMVTGDAQVSDLAAAAAAALQPLLPGRSQTFPGPKGGIVMMVL